MFLWCNFWVVLATELLGRPMRIHKRTVIHAYVDPLHIIKQACYGLPEHLPKLRTRPFNLSHVPWKGYLSIEEMRPYVASSQMYSPKILLSTRQCKHMGRKCTCISLHFLYIKKKKKRKDISQVIKKAETALEMRQVFLSTEEGSWTENTIIYCIRLLRQLSERPVKEWWIHARSQLVEA